MRFITSIVCASLCFLNTAKAQDLTPGEIYLLIKHARPSVTDADGWAIDLTDVMKVQNITTNRENVCAAIAIIDQESNFIANPSVAGLGALSEKQLTQKLHAYPIVGAYLLTFLDSHPTGQISYVQRIRQAKTERDLDLTYRSMWEALGTKTNMALVLQSGLLNSVIEERNDISTIGSMQVSVRFAIDTARARRFLPMTLSDIYSVRDELYTRRGGLYYGIKQLLDYNSGYNQKIFRFADFNAGRYSSRNAAFQTIISTLSKINLERDGDLLLYDKKGVALNKLSNSEKALRKLPLNLTHEQIRKDLMSEKHEDFAISQTFIAVKNLYLARENKPAPFAQLPTIKLSSPKLSHNMTTAIFAGSVDRRYKRCMSKPL